MTDKGFNLILKFESLPSGKPLEAYWDKYGKVWTIGYGATHYPKGWKGSTQVVEVKKGDKLQSKEEAKDLTRALIETEFEPGVRDAVTSDLNDNQYDALISFAYNKGVDGLKKSNVLALVNANPNDFSNIRAAFVAKQNTTANKQVLKGLKKRRADEAAMYCGTTADGGRTEPDMLDDNYDGGGNMLTELIKDTKNWKVVRFKKTPTQKDNWKSLTNGKDHPVVGDLLFAFHDGDTSLNDGKHAHVAIYLGVHDGHRYVAEGYSVGGPYKYYNESDKEIHVIKLEDSRMGLGTDIITHFAHCLNPEIEQQTTPIASGPAINEENMKHFTIKQLIANNGISDISDTEECKTRTNLVKLVLNVLDPLHEAMFPNAGPNENKIKVSSGYRTKKHNKEIGGALDSEHVTGQAADIYGASYSQNLTLAKTILEKNLPFQQLIVEEAINEGASEDTPFTPHWIHVSYNEEKGNKQEIYYTTSITYRDKEGKLKTKPGPLIRKTREFILNHR